MPERYLTRETPGIVPGETDLDWKLDVGAACNRVLEHAEELDAAADRSADAAQLVSDLRSLVERVATFEELQCAP